MREEPELTKDWDVVFDARGHLREPHTGRIVPIGTLEIRRHVKAYAAPKLIERFIRRREGRDAWA